MFNLEYIRHARRFFALHVPVYYYVKTKGSLCTQGLSISKTVQMKLTVFAYYNQFYKTVLDEEEYQRQRLKICRFLIDAAQDGAVPPLPAATRLGRERVRISSSALEGKGLLFDRFRERKLLDYYLEPAALKNGLSLQEARLLLCLRQSGAGTRRELADFAGLSRGALSMLLNRLEGKGLVTAAEFREPESRERRIEISFPPDAASLLADLETARQDYAAARLAGFSPEERAQYERLAGRVQDNIRDVLQ